MNCIKIAAEIIAKSRSIVALTGAGISAESGIPPFRGSRGLWDKYDPEEYATIEAFRQSPEKVWRMLKELGDVIFGAQPNDAHRALAELEESGILKSVITQNIDGLHQKAGSKSVIEFHGNHRKIFCTSCGMRMNYEDVSLDVLPPLCHCGGILKPESVLFGEPIPSRALHNAFDAAQTCGALLVVGTSAVVAPASRIPLIAKEHGAHIIEINTEKTILTGTISDCFIEGPSSQSLPMIVKMLRH